jgi:hypothetical protein
MTMTDIEVANQIARADRFREQLRAMIAETVVDPASLCADEQRHGLRRIAETLDAVPYVTTCNLANLDTAMMKRVGTGLMPIIEIHLHAVGGGPDFESATQFLAQFDRLIDIARKRMVN